MNTPRVEVDLGKILHNTQCLVQRLASCGISLTGVTKAVCGNPAIAQAMLKGGAIGLAESRISHVHRLRQAGIACPISMIRTPLMSQLDQVVQACDTSYNTERSVIVGLSAAAVRAKLIHNVILMVEMGDMREGILPQDVAQMALDIANLQGVSLTGIGANFACLRSTAPSTSDMANFLILIDQVESTSELNFDTISGGNSASLPWTKTQTSPTRINNLRVGEAILVGSDPVSGDQINGLYTDAFTLIAEVIETKTKQLQAPESRSILALGYQDTNLLGVALPVDILFAGATSDHTVITTRESLPVGTELRLNMNYSALMRSMAAPDIQTRTYYESIGTIDNSYKEKNHYGKIRATE